jgi:hypothetical protein
MFAHPHRNRAITPGLTLVHDLGRKQPMKPEDVLVRNRLGLMRAFLHPPQTCEVVQHLATRTFRPRRQGRARLHGPHFGQRERIAFDRGGSMRAPLAAVLLELRPPGDLHGGRIDFGPQLRHQLQITEQRGGNSELWLKGHRSIRQALVQ